MTRDVFYAWPLVFGQQGQYPVPSWWVSKAAMMLPCGCSARPQRFVDSWADHCLVMGKENHHPNSGDLCDDLVGCPIHCRPSNCSDVGGGSAYRGGSCHSLEGGLCAAKQATWPRRTCAPFAAASASGSQPAVANFARLGTVGPAWDGIESS